MMTISDEAVEAAARGMFAEEQCDRRQKLDLETNWLGRLDDRDRAEYRRLARAALEVAAPHMMAEDRADVWAEGHEDGFWNGRMSSGDTSNVALIGKEHADATNPYRRSI